MWHAVTTRHLIGYLMLSHPAPGVMPDNTESTCRSESALQRLACYLDY